MVLLPLLHQRKVDTLTKERVFTESLLALKLVGVEKVANNQVVLNQVVLNQVLLNQVAKVDGLANHHHHPQVQMAVVNQEPKLDSEFALVGLPEKLADKNAALLAITMEVQLIRPGHIKLVTLNKL